MLVIANLHIPQKTTSNLKRLHIRLSIWKKPSFGLFDYTPSNKDLIQKNYFISKGGFFLLDPFTNSVIEVNKFGINAQTEKYKKVEINIEKKQIIDHNNGEDISDCLWMQVRHPQAYIISEGDVIRLGKQKLIAKSIRLFGSTNKNKPDTPKIKTAVRSINIGSCRLTKECIVENQDSIDNGAVCRVCFEPNQDNDPFLNICLCSKHMPIHLSCIRRWLQKKAQTERFKNIIYCITMTIARSFRCHSKSALSVISS